MSSDYVDTYYARSLTNEAAYHCLDGDVETDICVIGGGLAGLATALGLAERGRKVVLLESRRIGWGASGRNGGFCMAGFALGNEDGAALAKKVGLDRARELYGLTTQAQKLIRSRIKTLDIPCDPVDGQVIAAWHKNEAEQKHVIDYMAKNFGMDYEFWPQEKVRDLYRTERYYDAVYLPGNFHIHPLRYVQGLARVITERGGKVFEDSAALSVDTAGDVKIVRTAKGAIKANQIVYCGSAYFNGLDKRLSRSCLPVATYVMVTEPLDDKTMRSAIRAPHAIHDTRFAYDYYRPLSDNRILWGGRVAYNKTPDQLEKVMHDDMVNIYPQLAGVKADIAWTGLMGYTVHKMPLIGHFAPGVWYCTNFGGNGVGPTTAGGELIAKAIAENDESYKLFEPFGFSFTGGPLGPLVAQAVYYSWELADKLGEWLNAKKAA